MLTKHCIVTWSWFAPRMPSTADESFRAEPSQQSLYAVSVEVPGLT